MKSLVCLLFFSLMLLSCSSNEVNHHENHDPYPMMPSMVFKVVSPEGVDLLNPNNPNAYLRKDIKVNYLLNDGTEVFYTYSNSTDHFEIITPEESGREFYFLNLRLNGSVKNEAITYIKWKNTDIDTIKSNYSSNSVFQCSEIWYNSKQVLEKEQQYNYDIDIEIIK